MYSFDTVSVSNNTLSADVSSALISASLSASTNAVTQLTLSFAEFDDFRVTRTGLFSPGASLYITDSGGARVRYEIAVMQIDERQAPVQLTIAARSYPAQRFKRSKEALVRRNLSPTEFLNIEAIAVGGTVVAEDSQSRGAISRVNNENQQESTWDVMKKMAGELGYLFFEYEGQFNFGRPTWFAERPTRWWIEYEDGIAPESYDDIIGAVKVEAYGVPSCRRSEDDKNNYATVDASLERINGSQVRPGDAVYFSGVPFWEGKYIVQSVQYDLTNEALPVSVSLVTPIDPKKPTTTGGGGSNEDGLSDLGTGIEGDYDGNGVLTIRERDRFYRENGRYPRV